MNEVEKGNLKRTKQKRNGGKENKKEELKRRENQYRETVKQFRLEKKKKKISENTGEKR